MLFTLCTKYTIGHIMRAVDCAIIIPGTLINPTDNVAKKFSITAVVHREQKEIHLTKEKSTSKSSNLLTLANTCHHKHVFENNLA